MPANNGLFSMPEFVGRNVLRLAPDAFIAMNTSVGARFLAPVATDSDSTGYKSLDVRGGITSMNINAAVRPAGASRANIEITAPIYKGLHEDYYITLPTGVRKPIFQPMMEVKIYLKGQYLKSRNPVYYPVFWGFVTNITESYSGGAYTFNLTCGDLLTWWKYQKLTIVPAAESTAVAGAPKAVKFSSLFENMNPWQIIYNLFAETQWKDPDGRRYDFIYPRLAKGVPEPPNFGALLSSREDMVSLFSGLSQGANQYWQRRFGNGINSPQDQRMQLEMFGLLNEVNLQNDRIKTALSYSEENRVYQTKSQIPEIDVNFYLLSQVQPYGAFNLYDTGSESLEHTKLEIANEVCEQTDMEFFLDTNGMAVFKPPFYNLDVNDSDTDIYKIKSKDVINFTGEINTDMICNYLEVYGPRWQFDPSMDAIGYNLDFDLIKRFGIRYQKMNLRYGNSSTQLRLIAVAKMSKINGQAFTGSVSIPMRPELRLGYPVYINHIDAYYYVTGINHSIAFGSNSTTTLSLEFRRDRVYSSGDIDGLSFGDILKGYVYRYDLNSNHKDFLKTFEEVPTDDRVRQVESKNENMGSNRDVTREMMSNDQEKFKELIENGVISGPDGTGFYKVSKANVTGNAYTGSSRDASDIAISNELIMINFPTEKEVASETAKSKETIPYTDRNGYRHIGGFPYGANLRLSDKDSKLVDRTDPSNKSGATADKLDKASADDGDDLKNRSGNQDENPYYESWKPPEWYAPLLTSEQLIDKDIESAKQKMIPNLKLRPETIRADAATSTTSLKVPSYYSVNAPACYAELDKIRNPDDITKIVNWASVED